jgi:hypothetical protein
MTDLESDPLFKSAPEHFSPQQREEVRQYIRNRPELRQIIQELISAVVTSKPEKPLDFAREYFQNLK